MDGSGPVLMMAAPDAVDKQDTSGNRATLSQKTRGGQHVRRQRRGKSRV